MNEEQQAQAWLASDQLPVYLREQLQEKLTDKKWLQDAFNGYLAFGTAGMRGLLEPGTNRINLLTIGRVTAGLARLIHDEGAEKSGVVISFDSRYHSGEFATHAAEILGHEGIKVYLFDSLRPTPELSFAIRYLHTAAGIMITSSHNAKIYNGYKIYGSDGGQLPPDKASQLASYTDQIDLLKVPTTRLEKLRADNTVQMVGEDVDQAYLHELANVNIDRTMIKKMAPKLKIIYTPLHGTGKMLYRRAFAQGGFTNVIPVASQAILDPEFATVEKPNPEFKQVFNQGIELAKQNGANLIVATDPDADRVGACVRTESGDFHVLTGNQMAALMANYVLTKKKEQGTLNSGAEIITSIVSSSLPFKIARHFGIQTKYVLTGFKYIGQEADRLEEAPGESFLMGFEESYGYLFKTFNRDKDAMQGALMLMEVAAYYAQRDMTLLDGLHEIWAKYGAAYEITQAIPISGFDGKKKMAQILAKLRAEKLTQINGVEVVRHEDYLEQTWSEAGQSGKLTGFPKSNVLKYFLADETWVALRPSGTEPVMKAYVGTSQKTPAEAKSLAQSYADFLKKIVTNA
jgi:phosphoglucomutase